MSWGKVILIAALCLPLLVVLALGFGRDPRATPSVLEGKPAPDFVLPTMDGGKKSLKDFRGKPVVLNFWASWCEPCKVEHDLLQQASQYYKDSVHFVGVVYQDTREAAEDYLRQRGNIIVQLLDENADAGVDFGVTGVPETFFIDASGILVKKHVGILNDKVIIETLADLGLAGPPRRAAQ